MPSMLKRCAGSVCNMPRMSERASVVRHSSRLALTFRQPLRLLVLAFDNHLSHDAFVVIVKRQTTAKKRIEDDSKRPHIGLDAQILLALQHLGASVACCPAVCLHATSSASDSSDHSQSTLLVLAGKAQIRKLHSKLTIEQDILQLEIAMNNALSVKPPDSNTEFAEQTPSLALEDTPSFHKIVEQLSTRT